MEDRLPRKLVAILYADVAGYSRLTGEDEDATHRRLSEYLDLISATVEGHRGRVMHYAGDAVLAMFDAVVDAVSCATEIQDKLRERNQELPNGRKVQFRIGVNSGDVIEDRGDIYGDGVNVAARLESLADPGGICISESVYTAVGKKLPHSYEFLGGQAVKNIVEPVRAYKVRKISVEKSKVTSQEKPKLEIPDKPSIAVLPFTNMSADPEQEYFSDGITEDIITALSKISGLLVVARHSTSVYKGNPVDIKQVGREQGVRYVLEGSVRKSGSRVRITSQLIDTTTGHHCWAERYDRDLDDIFAVQDEITRSVTIELQVQLTEGEQARVWAGGTDNVNAWELVVRATSLVGKHIREDTLEARRLADAAVELDPQYAPAWTVLGWTHWQDARRGWSNSLEKSLEHAFKAANTALDLQEDSPDNNALLGTIHIMRGQYAQAVEIMEKAVTLAPNHSWVFALSAVVLNYSGRPRDAIPRIKRAMRLSPIYPVWFLSALGNAYYLSGQHDLAIDTFRKAVEREPESVLPRVGLTYALIEAGIKEEAELTAEEILKIEPAFSVISWTQRHPFKDPTQIERLSKNLLDAGLPN